jgi:hypothetical protein
VGTVDKKRDADQLKPYIAPWLRETIDAALARVGVASSGGGGGGGGAIVAPPPPLTEHVLATTAGLGSAHTVSGLTANQVLLALGPTSAAFGQLLHSQLGSIGPDDHHARDHVLATNTGLGATHTIAGATAGQVLRASGTEAARFERLFYSDLQGTGAPYDVVAWTATDTITKRTPSADVSAGGTEILRSNAGKLTLLDGTIADELIVGSDLIHTRPNLLAVGINNDPDGAAALDIRAGATSDHSQRIRQIAGQTGRLWRIESTIGQELIVLDSVGNLQSGNPGFVSGLTGWQVTPVGNAEFNNGRFRGELHATVMVFDEVSVRNGTELITPAGGALELDVTIVSTGTPAVRNVRTTAFADQDFLDYRTDSVTGSGDMTARTIENILSFKNPDTGHYQVFRSGEVLRSKVWTGSGISDVWMRVNSALDMGTYYAYFVQVMSGTLPVTYTAGAAAAGYGLPGEGAIRLSADDPYGPLIDIFTSGAEPWNGEIYPHVRLGRLDGVGVPGLSGTRQYGIALGTNLADASQPYMYASNLGVRQYNIDSEWNDGANTTVRISAGGRALFGTNVDSPAGTFLDINPATGLATFRGAIEVVGTIPYGSVSDTPTLGALAAKNALAYGDAELTGLGTLAAVDNSLDNINNGSTYARVNSTLISGGNIRVGSGTKDSTLDGWNVDSTEIVGQLDGVDQVVLNTSGAISAGAGAVTLSGAGINIAHTNIIDTTGILEYDGNARYSALDPERLYTFSSPAETFTYGATNVAYAGGDIGGLAALSLFHVDPDYPSTWKTRHSLRLVLPYDLPNVHRVGYSDPAMITDILLDNRGVRLKLEYGGGYVETLGGIYFMSAAQDYWEGVPSFRSANY